MSHQQMRLHPVGKYHQGPSHASVSNTKYQSNSKQNLVPKTALNDRSAPSVGTQLQPQNNLRQIKKRSSKKDNLPLLQDYLVNCKILEANLSKDLSGFFSSSANVFCEICFKNTSIHFPEQDNRDPNNGQIVETKTSETAKNTMAAAGQNPKWENEEFSFNYERLTKSGQKKYASIKNLKIAEVVESIDQQLYFTLYKKSMLFQKDKIGFATIQLHNATPGSQTEWLVLTNEQDEEVGKLLAFIEIKMDIATKLSRQIQKDLEMHGQDEVKSMDSPDPGMTKDMTDERSMPLRGHQQVALLNERPEPQSNHQSNAPTVPLTQLTQVTHVTHQTQNSAIPLGGIGGFHGSNRSPNQSSNATAPFKHRAPTQNSIFALGNQTVGNISNPTGYLDTTNFIPNNKLSKNTNQLMLEGEMEGCIDGAGLAGVQNQTVNQRDFQDEYYGEEGESEYQEGEELRGHQKDSRGNHRSVLGLSHKTPHQALDNGLGRYNADQQAAISVAASAEDQENSSMLMGMGLLQMGVVATQHIREEYDEEDDDEENDDDEEEEYGNEQLDLDAEEESTHPVNEGGGPSQSTGGHDTNGNQTSNQNAKDSHEAQHVAYQTNEPQLTAPAASMSRGQYTAFKGTNRIQQRHQKGKHHEEEEDDESNINSDEQNEYPEVSGPHYQNHPPHPPDTQKSHNNPRQSQKRHPAIRPGTATGSTGATYKHGALYRSQLHQSQSEMNIRDSEEGEDSRHYQFQYQSHQSKMRGQAQQAAGGGGQSRSLLRGNGVSRQNTHQHLQGASKNMLGKQTPRGPSTGNRQGAYGLVGQQPIQNQQIKINTIEVEPSFRQRQGNIFQSGKVIKQSLNQAKPTDKILIKRGNRLPISTTPGALLGAHRQSQGLLLPPEARAGRGQHLQQQQSVGYPRPASQTRQQQQRNHGQYSYGRDGQGPSHGKGPNGRHINFNTNPQNQYLSSQQQSYFNSNVANTQVHTQEAQHNTNQTDGLGDFHLGEIDDEDLLLGEDSYSSERRARGEKSDSEDYVNSEGDAENYQKESPLPRKRGPPPRSQKKLRQPSQGRGMIEDRGILGGDHNLYDHHHHTTVGLTGGLPSGSIGTNPLEHETFSMGQQDTFQVDPNGKKAQQTAGTKPGNKGKAEWGRRGEPVLRPYTSHSGFGRDLNQRALVRSQKNELMNQGALHPNGSVIASDHQAGANGQADHSVIQHITSHSGSPSSEELADNQNHYEMMQNQMYPGGPRLSQSQKKSGNRRKQLLKQQEGGKRKHPYKQYDGYGKQSDSIHIGGGTVIGCSEDQRIHEGSSSGARDHHGRHLGSIVEENNHQTLMQELNTYQEYKDSAIMPHPPNIQQNHDRQRYQKHGEQSQNKAANLRGQVGATVNKQSRGERGSGVTSQPLIQGQRPYQKRGANSSGVAHLAARQHGVHHPSAGTLGVESELGSQLQGCGIGTLDGGQSLDQVDIFSQLNNRALSHEMQLNQIHLELKQKNERIKAEKQALREMKEKTKKEAKAVEEKQKELLLQQSQLQKAQHLLNQDKILVKNEAKKVQKLHHKFQSLIEQHNLTNGANIATGEVSEQLSSISVLLQLLLNDRTLQNEENEVGSNSKTQSPFKENLKSGPETSQIQSSSDQLQEMCQMYQAKLDEMSKAFTNMQNIQNLQIMSNKMAEIQNQMQQAQQFAPPGLGFATGIPSVGGGQLNFQMDSNQTVTPISHQNFAPMMQSALQANSNIASHGAVTPNHDQSQILSGQPVNAQIYPNQSQMYEQNQIVNNNFTQPNYGGQLLPQNQELGSSLVPEQDIENNFSESINEQQNCNPVENPQSHAQNLMDNNESPEPLLSSASKPDAMAEDQGHKSSSSSEFVFNPDPNFLANINANIKMNNEKFANQGANIQDGQVHQKSEQQQMESQQQIEQRQRNQLSAIMSDEGDEYSQNKDEGHHIQDWGHQEQDIGQIGQNNAGSQDQQANDILQAQSQPIASSSQPAIQEDEREALISDCGSDIQIEEADEDAPNVQSQIEETKDQAAQQTQSSQALVQGTQGDFQIPNNAQSQTQTLSQSSQMSVFNQIQSQLQKIGRPNQYASAVNHEEVKVSIDEVESPLIEDIQMSNYQSQAPARKDINELVIDSQNQNSQKKVSKDDDQVPQKQALIGKDPKSSGREAVSENENQFSQEDSDEDEMEQSVVYSTNGKNIYDQPHRAVYGIKPVKNNF